MLYPAEAFMLVFVWSHTHYYNIQDSYFYNYFKLQEGILTFPYSCSDDDLFFKKNHGRN